MSYIPEYHENYYRVEGTAYNQGKIGIGTINPVQLLHVSGGNFRLDGTGYVNGDLNVTGNLNVYGSTAQFAVSQVIAEDKSIELNVATGSPIGGGSYTTSAFTDDAGADEGGLVLKSTQGDKVILYETVTPASGWVSNLRWVVSGNYGKNTLQLSDATANVGMTIGTDANSVNLYRSANDILKTDDNLIVGINGGKTTLQLSDTTVNVGLTIGADTNLYRSAADTLKTDDSFVVDGAAFSVNSATITLGDANTDTVTINAGPVNLPNATSAADALVLGADAVIYRSANNTLTTDDNFSSTFAGGKTTLSLSDTTTNVGMTLGGDTNIYRSIANVLKTDDSLTVDLDLTVNGNTSLGNLATDTLTVTATPTINIPDNTSNAFRIREGSNNYLTIDTVDTTEFINIANASGPKVKILSNSESTSSTAGSLQVAGGVGIAKSLSMGGFIHRSVAVVTAGTDALGQGPLTKDVNIVTTNASAPGAVTLPTPVAGMQILISNKTVNALKVYPSTNAIQIDTNAVGTAYNNIAATTAKTFVATSATQWYSI